MSLGIYLVTDRALCGSRGVAETVRAALDGGVGIVQLREKEASDADVARQLEQLAALTAGRALLLVNDRLKVVVEARKNGVPVDGVHLGQSDHSVREARDLLGPDALIGLTANTGAHLATVGALPQGTVDHLGVGVIHPTSTKPDHPPALGIDGFSRIAQASPLPAIAIGGVRIADIAPLRRAGAAGVAVVSAICAAVDPEEVSRQLVTAWDTALS